MKIGFIGIGIMGAPMAGRLLDGGHELFVNDINPIPQTLLDKGATVVGSAREAAEMGEIVIVMVPDTPDVEVVLFGENGVAGGLSDGKIVVDMSSISPVETKAFAAKINALGCRYLDAPVSGGEVGAKAGSLTIMVGGRSGDLRQGHAVVRIDGPKHHPGGKKRRRSDLQGGQPDHCGTDHRGGGRGAAVRIQGRR